MKIQFNIFIAIIICTANTLNVFAAQIDANGKYTDIENKEQRSITEQLYNERPFVLKQAEDLSRGLTAVPRSDGGILVTWRMTGVDSPYIKWDLYRNNELIAEHIPATNFVDIDGKSGDTYSILSNADNYTLVEDAAAAWGNEYISFSVKIYENCSYNIDDIAVGDVDNDGEYEYIVKRIPENYFNLIYYENDEIIDNRTGYPLIECYDNDGTYLWTVNIGKNEVNHIDINHLVYDFNGDGYAEVAMRTVDGTVDGTGNVIGDSSADHISSLQKFNDRQYLSEGGEFLSVFDGKTGKEIARSDLYPSREPLSSWASFSNKGKLTKRASHYCITTAYLNGETPSIVFVRGAWDGMKLAAYDYDTNLVKKWEYDSGNADALDNIYGAGYHSIAVADIDFDGKDEILSGAFALDDDGSFMYATQAADNEGNIQKLAHGDAFDVAVMTPEFNGYYVWSCHEHAPLPANIDLHDARTGQVIYGFGKTKDTGRSRAADIDPTSKGYEVWGSTGTQLMNLYGEVLVNDWNKFQYINADGSLGNKGSLPMNFKLYWDGDLLSELLDDVKIYKYDWENKRVKTLMDNSGQCISNNSTKAVPCLVADLFGDWRDEVIWSDAEKKNIIIYSTNIETDYRIPTLMHDITYRQSIAWQNNHYNQPPNTGFYLGYETETIPLPEIITASGKSTLKKHTAMNVKPDAVTDICSEINDIKVDTKNSRISVSVDYNLNEIAVMYVGIYDINGILLKCLSKNISVTDNVDFGYLPDGANYIKAFLWNNSEGMKPLCPSKQFNIK